MWEVVKVLREIDERGPAAVAAAAEVLALPEAKVSEAAEAAWHAERRLLA
ncbi:MAG TPA: hypothetical protein VK585_07305 [Jiangellaceae bacterium]|nr:hypothetical protein [Jiangellaceae bacterium]